MEVVECEKKELNIYTIMQQEREGSWQKNREIFVEQFFWGISKAFLKGIFQVFFVKVDEILNIFKRIWIFW